MMTPPPPCDEAHRKEIARVVACWRALRAAEEVVPDWEGASQRARGPRNGATVWRTATSKKNLAVVALFLRPWFEAFVCASMASFSRAVRHGLISRAAACLI
eukprot:2179467-Alexandrium_andersonii.AAC.1